MKRLFNLFLVALVLAGLSLPVMPHRALADSVDLYWFGGSGNWSDTAHWGTSTNGTGAPHAAPTTTNNVFFDANSFTAPGQTVTVDAASSANSMNWTGVTNTPTLALNLTFNLTVLGNVEYSPNMTTSGSKYLIMNGTGKTLKTNGLTLVHRILASSGSISLADAFSGTQIDVSGGTFSTAGYPVTLTGSFNDSSGAGPKTVSLGSSTINTAVWNFTTSTSNLTLSPNTATIIVTAINTFGGGNNQNYYNVILDSTNITVAGSNKFNQLSANSSKTQAITFTGGTTQTANAFSLSGSSGHQHTLQSSNTTNWNISVLAGNVSADFVTISRSTANVTGGQAYNAVGLSLDGGNNVGWTFPTTLSTQAASGISMDKDGGTEVTLNGTITDFGGQSSQTTYFDWGDNVTYGNTTPSVVQTVAGAKTQALSSNSYLITVNSTALTDYGFTYPITYAFNISAAANNVTAFRRYSTSEAWTALPVKVRGTDTYNGIEALSMNYTADIAYASVLIGTSSNLIYLKFEEDGDQTALTTSYNSVPVYYDDRHAAVTTNFDDVGGNFVEEFMTGVAEFQSRNIWTTVGIDYTDVMSAANWTSIQNAINAGYVEIGSHSRSHPHPPYADTAGEVAGSKSDILANLTLPALQRRGSTEYLTAWLEPFGENDAAIVAQLGTSKYLVDRGGSGGGAESITTWNGTIGMFNRAISTIFMDSSANATALNAAYDAKYAAGGVYWLSDHAASTNWTAGAYAQTHLDYIKEKKDVWYVGSGNMYQYELARVAGMVTVTTDAGLTPGNTYHFRFTTGAASGSDQSFTLTMPSVVTGGITTPLQDNNQPVAVTVSGMGVASSTYVGVEFGATGAFGQTAVEQTAVAAGAKNFTLTGYDSTRPLYYRGYARVGSVYSYGQTYVVQGGRSDSFVLLRTVLGLTVAAGILIVAVVMGMAGNFIGMVSVIGVGIVVLTLVINILG